MLCYQARGREDWTKFRVTVALEEKHILDAPRTVDEKEREEKKYDGLLLYLLLSSLNPLTS